MWQKVPVSLVEKLVREGREVLNVAAVCDELPESNQLTQFEWVLDNNRIGYMCEGEFDPCTPEHLFAELDEECTFFVWTEGADDMAIRVFAINLRADLDNKGGATLEAVRAFLSYTGSPLLDSTANEREGEDPFYYEINATAVDALLSALGRSPAQG